MSELNHTRTNWYGVKIKSRFSSTLRVMTVYLPLNVMSQPRHPLLPVNDAPSCCLYYWKYLRANLNIDVVPASACRHHSQQAAARSASGEHELCCWLVSSVCHCTSRKGLKNTVERPEIWLLSPSSSCLRQVTEAVCFPGDRTRTQQLTNCAFKQQIMGIILRGKRPFVAQCILSLHDYFEDLWAWKTPTGSLFTLDVGKLLAIIEMSIICWRIMFWSCLLLEPQCNITSVLYLEAVSKWYHDPHPGPASTTETGGWEETRAIVSFEL